jgi:archaellum component FlaC
MSIPFTKTLDMLVALANNASDEDLTRIDRRIAALSAGTRTLTDSPEEIDRNLKRLIYLLGTVDLKTQLLEQKTRAGAGTTQ